MKEVTSNERSTGMGATRFTAILTPDGFTPVSEILGARYLGRSSGVHSYIAEVPDDAIVARFYRSNSSKESVSIEGGPTFASFSEADRWADEQLGKAKNDNICPFCGAKVK